MIIGNALITSARGVNNFVYRNVPSNESISRIYHRVMPKSFLKKAVITSLVGVFTILVFSPTTALLITAIALSTLFVLPYLACRAKPIEGPSNAAQIQHLEKMLPWIISKEFSKIQNYLEVHEDFELNSMPPFLVDGLFMQTAASGNVELLQTLIKKGAHVNAKDRDGSTALSLALLKYENIPVARALLATPEIKTNLFVIKKLFCDQKIHMARAFIETPGIELYSIPYEEILQKAIRVGDDQIVLLLLEKNLLASSPFEDIRDSLFLTIEHHRDNLIKPFISLCLNINQNINFVKYETSDRLTPLRYSISAAIKAKEKDENSPESNPTLPKALKIFFEILKIPNASLDPLPEYWHPLHQVVSAGIGPILFALLDRNISVNLKDPSEQTLLVRAAWDGHKEIVLELLRRGANVNFLGSENCSALLKVTRHNRPERNEIALALLKAGAKVEFRNKWKDTALHHAIYNNNPQIVEAIRQSNFRHFVEIQQYHRLMDEASYVELDIVNSPIVARSEPLGNFPQYSVTNIAKTPLHFAAEKGFVDIVNILLKFPRIQIDGCTGFRVDPETNRAIEAEPTSLLQILVNEQYTSISKEQPVPLEEEAQTLENNKLKIITFLVKAGANYSFIVDQETIPNARALAAVDAGKQARRAEMSEEILPSPLLDLVGSY